MRRRALGLLVLGLAGCSRTPHRESAPTSTEPSASPLSADASPAPALPEDCARIFAPPERSELVCDEHVLGSGAEIHWRSFGIKDAPGTIEPSFRARATQCGYGPEPPGVTISDHAALRLTIFAAGDKSYPTCSTPPKAEHQTVIVISEKHDRK